MNSTIVGLLLVLAGDPGANMQAKEVVKFRVEAYVTAGIEVDRDIPFIFRVETTDGGATAFKFRDGWALTAAHNINNCEMRYAIEGEVRKAKCWNHPGNVDIAVCHSNDFSFGESRVGIDYSGIDGSGTGLFVVAGYGCSGACVSASHSGSAEFDQTAGVLKFLGPGPGRQLVDLRSIGKSCSPICSGACTQVCGGDSGGPVFTVIEKIDEPAFGSAVKLSAVEIGYIKGVIFAKSVDKGYRVSTVTSFSAVTEEWLKGLTPTSPTDCEQADQ